MGIALACLAVLLIGLILGGGVGIGVGFVFGLKEADKIAEQANLCPDCKIRIGRYYNDCVTQFNQHGHM